MNRREMMSGLLGGGAAFARSHDRLPRPGTTGATPRSVSFNDVPQGPNVLIFLPDAVQAQVIAPGSPCLTPHLDRVVDRGMRFSRATTINPVCSPARASLMTGLLPHNHGVLEVEHVRDPDQCVLRRDKVHFAQRLSEAGYRTGYFGKWHIERTNKLQDFGWQVNGAAGTELLGTLGRGEDDPVERRPDPALSRYVTQPEGYRKLLRYGVVDMAAEQRPPARTVRAAQAFLAESLQGDQPWCCCISFAEPNEALLATRETYERYDPDKLPLPTTLHDDLRGRPGLYRRVQRTFSDSTEQDWRRATACYYARISELDDLFGKIIEQLNAAGALDNTIVILASDHGRYLGAHGFDNHNFGAFDEAYRIPMVFAGPGVARGVECPARVTLMDLGLTILELTGTRAIDRTDGRSFAPLLGQPAAADRYTTAFAEFHGTRFSLTQRVLWEGDWKLVFNGFDEDELYDLAADPFEVQNLVHDPAHTLRHRQLMQQMWQIMRRSNDRTLMESHYYPMRFAAVGPLA